MMLKNYIKMLLFIGKDKRNLYLLKKFSYRFFEFEEPTKLKLTCKNETILFNVLSLS